MNFFQKTCKKDLNRTSEHHHQTSHIRKSLRIKFQLKLTVFNFYTKLTQKRCFQSKKEKQKIAIKFCLQNQSRFQISVSTNNSVYLKQFSQKRILPNKTGKNEHHHRILNSNYSAISDKNYGKNCYLDSSVFLTPSLLLTMLRNNEKNLRKDTLWVRNIVQEERGILNTLFKIPIFCH